MALPNLTPVPSISTQSQPLVPKTLRVDGMWSAFLIKQHVSISNRPTVGLVYDNGCVYYANISWWHCGCWLSKGSNLISNRHWLFWWFSRLLQMESSGYTKFRPNIETSNPTRDLCNHVLRNCACFSSPADIYLFTNTSFRLKRLDPDQARYFVEPYLGLNCLHVWSADDKSRHQREKS